MVNEDIVTALKNAVERGQDLESTMQVMISSGYNPKDIKEASNYIGGLTGNLQANPDENFQ